MEFYPERFSKQSTLFSPTCIAYKCLRSLSQNIVFCHCYHCLPRQWRTNIQNTPQEEGITVVCHAYEVFHNNNPPIPSALLREMLGLILKENLKKLSSNSWNRDGHKNGSCFCQYFHLHGRNRDFDLKQHKTTRVETIHIFFLQTAPNRKKVGFTTETKAAREATSLCHAISPIGGSSQENISWKNGIG